jgi:hypothetical protein
LTGGVVKGVAEEAEVEESVMLFVEDREAPLVVEKTELCSVDLERPDRDSEDGGLEEGEEPEVDPEEAVLVTLPEPVEKLPVDGISAFGSDQQWPSFG